MTPRLWEDVLELQKQAKLKDNVIFPAQILYCPYYVSLLQLYASKHLHFYSTRQSIWCSDSMTKYDLKMSTNKHH